MKLQKTTIDEHLIVDDDGKLTQLGALIVAFASIAVIKSIMGELIYETNTKKDTESTL